MSDVSQWSPTDANNSAAPPDGYPEGMPASAVNDSSRAVMGGVRRLAEDGGWFDWGHAATYISATSFQVPGDLTALYAAGRRIRATQTGDIVGTIESSSVSVNTTVNVVWDSGGLSNAALTVALGPDPVSTAGGFVTGEIRMFGFTPGGGWLPCDAAAVSRTTYAALFAVIGTTFGAGDGSTTFNVPDSRGRSPMGAGQGNTAEGGGTGTNRTTGQTTGAETHTLTINELAVHTHTVDSAAVNSDGGGVVRSPSSDGPTQGGPAGGDQPHNNMHPSFVVGMYIKT